jgi:hypothetical protein
MAVSKWYQRYSLRPGMPIWRPGTKMNNVDYSSKRIESPTFEIEPPIDQSAIMFELYINYDDNTFPDNDLTIEPPRDDGIINEFPNNMIIEPPRDDDMTIELPKDDAISIRQSGNDNGEDVEFVGKTSRREAKIGVPREFVNKWIIAFPVHAGRQGGAEH